MQTVLDTPGVPTIAAFTFKRFLDQEHSGLLGQITNKHIQVAHGNYAHWSNYFLLVKLYSASVSDLHIVKQSGLTDKLDMNDDVMADRGLNIRHLLLPKKCTLNLPAFSHGKTLGARVLKQSRKIASIRIHVERAICKMKTFQVLSGIIPLKLRYILDQVVAIVAVLCNLQERLV